MIRRLCIILQCLTFIFICGNTKSIIPGDILKSYIIILVCCFSEPLKGLKLIDHFSGYCGAIRMNGSAALSLCWVASGRWDGWLEQYLGPWDFMAGMLIVREAEGKVTNYEGEEDMLEGNAVVASNGTIHNDLLNALK